MSDRIESPLPAIPYARAWNIAARTVHIAAAGMLLGGHFFDVARERLWGLLIVTIASGVILAVLEAWPRLLWFVQGRGAATLLKLILIAVVPLFWPQRVWILLVVLAVGSVGSHMPARWRYHSFLHGRMISYGCGPGTKKRETPPE
ncbi:hypothetical protein JCM19992_18130 [Thermostilla marina]